MKRIIRCQAIDVDMNHAKDGFLTDTQITGNRVNGERTLEEWVPDEDENAVSLELDETDTNGWRAEDMFKANEETYGVQVRILILLICHETFFFLEVVRHPPTIRENLSAAFLNLQFYIKIDNSHNIKIFAAFFFRAHTSPIWRDIPHNWPQTKIRKNTAKWRLMRPDLQMKSKDPVRTSSQSNWKMVTKKKLLALLCVQNVSFNFFISHIYAHTY